MDEIHSFVTITLESEMCPRKKLKIYGYWDAERDKP